ncbi:ATP synthase subunit I [Amphritea japonica]|uniref:ATP synthase protein I n=1 Tax=Amphritea japonica ATCC BAA-1530 TaxID=1278309 RepID=A0A7R6PP93_9GAMM|nr:ATP synthase subunit I [Amphritea japonica]BBB27950.1 ATP synthase protein I [Amphritea japonica ATCC BAA-1530]
MRNGHQKIGVHARIALQQFRKVFLIQVVSLIVIAGVSLLHSLSAAYSSLCGGLIFLLPSYVFAYRALVAKQAKNTPGAVVTQLYTSEIWKMGLSIALFSAVFILVQPLNPFSLFGTYIWLQLVGFFAQLKLNNRFLKL